MRTIYTFHLEYDTYTIKPNTFKPLEHMNIDIKGSANINLGPSKVIFLHYYKELCRLITLFKRMIGIAKIV
jgi:hypothetical protein